MNLRIPKELKALHIRVKTPDSRYEKRRLFERFGERFAISIEDDRYASKCSLVVPGKIIENGMCLDVLWDVLLDFDNYNGDNNSTSKIRLSR